MYFPDARRSEEAADDSLLEGRKWPFIEILQLLREHDVRVPELLGADCDRGWILVEDLGDATLADVLHREPERKTELYRTAVRDVARAQRALDHMPDESVVRTRRFDETLLLWELEHFREYGLSARGIELTPQQTEQFTTASQQIAQQVAELPTGFVHRDYQSRNLMVVGENELAWVDFQDALLGPQVYDLVALLNDSYQSFDDAFVDARLSEFVEHRGLPADEFSRIRREFDLVTIQRKLKDAGRFVYIERNKGDASYLRFVEPTLRKVENSMCRLSDDPAVGSLMRLLDDVLS
jgi:aminoglycoside/choline kinase family phosphotransferase